MNDPLYLSPIFFSFVLLLCCSQWVHDIWSQAQLLKSYFVREGKLGCFDLSSCFFSSSKMAALFFASSNGDFPELFLMLMLQPRFSRTFTMSKLPLETLKLNSNFFLTSPVQSSRGGLEVEQWSDNRTLCISVDQSPLGACMIICYQLTCYVMYVLDVCYMCV